MKKLLSAVFVCLLCFSLCLCSSCNSGDGASAYEKAVSMGYDGTQEEFLAALVGENVEGEKNAYEIASEKGFEGSYEEWLSLLNINSEKEN